MKKNDERVYRAIVSHTKFPTGAGLNRRTLGKALNMDPREVGYAVERLRATHCILNFQDGAGWFTPDESTAEGQAQIDRWMFQEYRRAMSILASLEGAASAQKNIDMSRNTLIDIFRNTLIEKIINLPQESK